VIGDPELIAHTFGAVVLTLKATGWLLLLVMVNDRLTRVVSGPLIESVDDKICDTRQMGTSKAKRVAGIELYRHFWAGKRRRRRRKNVMIEEV